MSLPVYYSTVEAVYQSQPIVGSLTNVTSIQIARYLGEADAVINARLASRYTMPMSPSPPILETISTNICLYTILGKRVAANQPAGATGRNEWYDRYKDSMDLLTAIADGDLLVLTSSGAVITPAVGDGVAGEIFSTTMNFTPTFNTDGVGYDVYSVDADKDPDS